MGTGFRSCLAVAVLASVASPRAANAFGIYVTGGDPPPVVEATQVVLMRSGTRTVVAIQDHLKGVPESFAIVIPVPATLKDTDVKALPGDVFRHVEQLTAPRLVEYWEQDPCAPEADVAAAPRETAADKPSSGAKVEAQVTAGEYQIAIVAAKDIAGLDAWLRQEKYSVSPETLAALRPSIERGMKILVARVDPKKLAVEDGRATLSPLRLPYDAAELALPIALGATQDLSVTVIASGQRYEAANRPNVMVPTNIDVTAATKSAFRAFYAALLDRTIERTAGAVVTEYAGSATTCDPCTAPALSSEELQALGADVPAAELVLTRMHARPGKELVLVPAQPIAGGREIEGPSGALEQDAHADPANRFQARYAIRHPWDGPIRCASPRRGVWGGPSIEVARDPGYKALGTVPALDLAFAPRDTVKLATAITSDVPALGLEIGAGELPPAPPQLQTGSGSATQVPAKEKRRSGCGCQASGAGDALGPGGVLLLGAVARRRRRARRSSIS